MRVLLAVCLAVALPLASVVAQHEAHGGPAKAPASTAAPATETKPAAERKRGTGALPEHHPQLALHPLLAFEHVQAGNAAAVAARTKAESMPAPKPRPAGAGRYVCAVVVCADCDVDVPALLGLRREDVLLLAVPGPFVGAETVALLERVVVAERLSLVLVLGHAACRSLAPAPGSPGATTDGTAPTTDPLVRRAEVARREAERRRQALPKTVAQMQRELLLAASDLLTRRSAADELRVLPGEIDPKSGAIVWHHRRVDTMPLAPVR